MCVCALSLLVCPSLTNSDKPLALLLLQTQLAAWRSILCGKVLFTNLRSSQGGAFPVGNPYLPTQLAAWRSVSCGKFLFTNSTAAFRVGNSYLQTQLERFVWEISIYKLNWSVSCGKFLFTNSTSVFSLFTNYLQTSFLREKAFSRRAIHGQKSSNQTLDFYMPVPENSFFP